MQLQEPKARESLLTPTMRRSPSKASLSTTETTASSQSHAPSTTASSLEVSEKPLPASPSLPSPLPHVSFANAALMERTAFAIDSVKDDEEEEDATFGIGGDDDDQVMDEVCRIFHRFVNLCFLSFVPGGCLFRSTRFRIIGGRPSISERYILTDRIRVYL